MALGDPGNNEARLLLLSARARWRDRYAHRNKNLRQEEETARIAEQSVPGLIRKAKRAPGQEGQQQGKDKGLIHKAKDKLTG